MAAIGWYDSNPTLPYCTYPFEVLGGEVEEAILGVLFFIAMLSYKRISIKTIDEVCSGDEMI